MTSLGGGVAGVLEASGFGFEEPSLLPPTTTKPGVSASRVVGPVSSRDPADVRDICWSSWSRSRSTVGEKTSGLQTTPAELVLAPLVGPEQEEEHTLRAPDES